MGAEHPGQVEDNPTQRDDHDNGKVMFACEFLCSGLHSTYTILSHPRWLARAASPSTECALGLGAASEARNMYKPYMLRMQVQGLQTLWKLSGQKCTLAQSLGHNALSSVQGLLRA